jgi:hypothetical protein
VIGELEALYRGRYRQFLRVAIAIVGEESGAHDPNPKGPRGVNALTGPTKPAVGEANPPTGGPPYRDSDGEASIRPILSFVARHARSRARAPYSRLTPRRLRGLQ